MDRILCIVFIIDFLYDPLTTSVINTLHDKDKLTAINSIANVAANSNSQISLICYFIALRENKRANN